MQLSETKFIRLDGCHVVLEVSSDDEARAALKELRHKKREFRHIKRRLSRAKQAASQRAKSRRRKSSGEAPTFAGPFDYVTRSLGAVVALVRGGETLPKRARAESRNQIEAELAIVDETMLNLDEAILHVTGKLG